MNQQRKIGKITIKHIYDDSPDLSFLEQYDEPMSEERLKYNGLTEEQRVRYAAEDRIRLENYGITWHMIGIVAEAEIYLNNGNLPANNWQIHEVKSGGLWGIETDSGQEYFDEVAQEQIADLKDTLKMMGFTEEQINEAPIVTERDAEW